MKCRTDIARVRNNDIELTPRHRWRQIRYLARAGSRNHLCALSSDWIYSVQTFLGGSNGVRIWFPLN
jgi:hypothetical protein